MNIGFLIYGKLSRRTGGYLYDTKLVEYLTKKDDHVKIISLPNKQYFDNIQYSFSSHLFNRLKKLDVDIFLQDVMCYPTLFFINRRLKQDTDIRLISIVHNLKQYETQNNQDNFAVRFFEKQYLETIDDFIFISNTARKSVEALLQRSVSGLVALPGKNHLGPKKRKKVTKSYCQNQRLKLVFVGNLFPNKGLHVLLRSLSTIDTDKWILTVIGDPNFDKKYSLKIQKLIHNLKLENNVFFKGFVSRSRLSRYFENNHLLAVPSYYESLGIVYIEALGFALPVIASQNGGAKEIITHGEEGYLVSPGDFSTLRKYINNIIKNPQILIRLSRKASERYKNLPTWNKSMGKIWKYIHSIYK